MVDKPCGCKEKCGHYAWLEDKDYLAEQLSEENEKVEEIDLREKKDDSFKHKIFMEGKCIKCKVKVAPIPDSVYTEVGLLEFPLHNFKACNGTLYHIECPKKEPVVTRSQDLINKDLLLD